MTEFKTDAHLLQTTVIASTDLNRVHHADFLDNNLPDKCAKLIIADPPYFEIKGDFDFVWSDIKEYLKDVEKWAIECKRLLADNGTLFWYGHAKNIAYAQVIFDMHFNLINNLVWDKGSFMGLEESEGLRSFAPCTERILMYGNEEKNFVVDHLQKYLLSEFRKCGKPVSFYKELCGFTGNQPYNWFTPNNNGKAQWAFPKKEHYQKLSVTGFFLKEYEELKAEYEELKAEYEELRRPFANYFKLQEIFRFSNEAVKTGAKYDHDTVKPETLTRALILTCSRPDDLVLAPFAGSGTEVAMAIKEGRKAIGYDIEKKYVDMANRRVDIIKAQPSLFCFA